MSLKSSAVALLVAVGACAGPDSGSGGEPNPSVLWFAMKPDRTGLQLVADEPNPY